MFKTSHSPKPAAPKPLLIVANTTLEQDKATVMRCWLDMGGKKDDLRMGNMYMSSDDDVSEWLGVTVEGGRVTKLNWGEQNLDGMISAEVGALSALYYLRLGDNSLRGTIPPSIGALTSLKTLLLRDNELSGEVPSTLANLTNLNELGLHDNHLNNAPDSYFEYKPETQVYLHSLCREPTLRLLNYGIAITKARLDASSSPPSPLFALLADHEHTLYGLILSFLDPLYCCNKDCTALLKCWKSLGGAEDELRQGYGDDVARWYGVQEVRHGRVRELDWMAKGFKGTLPADVGDLDGLKYLFLGENEISGLLPSTIGKLTNLDLLSLYQNRLTGPLPSSIGQLTALTKLYLHHNLFSGAGESVRGACLAERARLGSRRSSTILPYTMSPC